MKNLQADIGAVSWPVVLLIGFLMHVAFTPVESQDGTAGVPFALIVRLGAWILIAIISYFSTKSFFCMRLKPFFFLCAVFLLFLISNLLAGTFPVLMLAVMALGIYGAAVINSACESSQRFRSQFVWSLNILIIFWVFTFLIQTVWYYVAGEVLQMHAYFSPFSIEEQRTHLLSSGLARLGGAHIEPGTYVNWLFGLVLIKAFYQRRLFGFLGVFALLTMPIAMSFWGVIAFFFSLASFFIFSKKNSIFYLNVFLFFGALGCVLIYFDTLSVAYEYFEYRSQGDDDSTDAKVDGYAGFFLNISSYWLAGAGVDYDFCSGCLSPQDSGVFVNLAVQLGLVGAVFSFLTIFAGYYRAFGIAGVVLLTPVVIAKWYYWDPIFLLLMTSGFCYAEKKMPAKN